MTKDPEFRVQYQDSAGSWNNIGWTSYASYSEALDKLLSEGKNDPEYSHRIVRSQVLGFITGEGEFDE